MYAGNVTKSIIKIVGLVGDLPKNSVHDIEQLLKITGFEKEIFPTKLDNGSKVKNNFLVTFLKDYFYPDFRNIMFLEHEGIMNTRLVKDESKEVVLIREVKKPSGEKINKLFPINVRSSEVFLFPGQIGLFSIAIDLKDSLLNYQDINDILYLIRNFDTLTETNLKWHEWISKNILGGINLRGESIKADEFSGSKFKLFTVIDCSVNLENRNPLLYDMATVSSLGSALSSSGWAPSNQYYEELMKSKISFFNNWEALCLFDSFTCIGTGQLNEHGTNTWEYTYFRIYLYRLFFKFNIYRYNSTISDGAVNVRNQFEKFLNDYNLSHISFNFLANEIYKKTGEALDINLELTAFQSRINRLYATIQEKKQSKTNILLQIVTVLGGISSVQPVIGLLNHLKSNLGWSSFSFYSLFALIIVSLGLGVLYWLMPDVFKKYGKRVMKLWK